MDNLRNVGARRNATLPDLVEILRDTQARMVDIVTPAGAIRARDGQLVVSGAEPELSDSGVTLVEGVYTPTAVADEGLATKLGIPLAYLRQLREQHIDLYDRNVNGWLDHPAHRDRRLLLRALRHDHGGGIIRAVLSDRYKPVDNLDVLLATLAGIRDSGAQTTIDGADLTDRHMHVRVRSDSVRALAPSLLRDYRSPFTGQRGADNPVVWAGFVLTNSEVGAGAFTITPRLVVQVCNNGLTIARDAVREVHLGGRLEEGTVSWSADTQRKALALVTAKVRDAVAAFLTTDYVERQITAVQQRAAVPVDDPAGAVEVVSRQLHYTAEQQTLILRHFVKGADLTAGGLLHAVTSAAQALPDADAAHAMEAQALRVLDIAARV
ncbi:DUF932 domain-containing protein [Parafrankia sp. FMc6]|uniref:DUF932 domain-containing protein n=1 Tax=Parafrankia soli TaxID=2599596 RepID=UPI0034D51DDD